MTDGANSQPGSGVPRQVCRNCNEEKPVTLGAWAYKPGGEPLQICLLCQTRRKVDAKEAAGKKGGDKMKTPAAIRGEAKMDVARALKAGAHVANEYVDLVMARVLQYAADPDHKLHGWALQFLAERIMPRKLYEELGGQAAGVVTKEARPYLIQVIGAQPAAPAAIPAPRVIDIPSVEVKPSTEGAKE
jgi:hypothetical protein